MPLEALMKFFSPLELGSNIWKNNKSSFLINLLSCCNLVNFASTIKPLIASYIGYYSRYIAKSSHSRKKHACLYSYMMSLQCNWPLQSTRVSVSIELRMVWDFNILYEQFCTVLSIPIQFMLLRSTKKEDCVRIPTIILSAIKTRQYW